MGKGNLKLFNLIFIGATRNTSGSDHHQAKRGMGGVVVGYGWGGGRVWVGWWVGGWVG